MTGSGFVTLAATLHALDTVPVAGIALILGVDRFMSEARAITNLIGNGVATVAIGRWEGALDRDRMRRVLAGEPFHDPVLADDLGFRRNGTGMLQISAPPAGTLKNASRRFARASA